jgi:tetratricopeptide (TPR) repeat protein
MQTGLAEAWWSRVAGQAVESGERLAAESNLAVSLFQQGKSAEAEPIFRRVHAVEMRVYGAEHPHTLTSASNLASTLSYQGKYADAERIQREVLRVRKGVLGAEHPYTLTTAGNLAESLSRQGKYTDAERIGREVLGLQTRVLGPEHPSTLASANNLAQCVANQGRFADAERIQREVLAVYKRVLGPEHPNTLMTTSNLAISLANQGQHAEAGLFRNEVLAVWRREKGPEHHDPLTTQAANDLAAAIWCQGTPAETERMLEALLASVERVRGSAHPNMLGTARALESLRAAIGAKPPTNAAAPAAPPLPAGTRVLVQRLVGKPEHNGKRARVLSFDARTGRYAVALDDGKELSLKAECVARPRCAAAGCTSEEAGSVCGRCQAVWYCSRECQRTDWRAHKPACAAAHTS